MKKTLLSLTLITAFANAEMVRSNAKEVVLDTDTNLMWQDNSDAKTVSKDWQGAITYCSNLTLGGFDDWRLPNKDILKALYPKKQSLAKNFYWSSSSDVSSSGKAWFVYSGNGGDGTTYKSDNWSVRCVRDSSAPLTFDSFSAFSKAVGTATMDKKEVVLRSSRVSAKEFLVKVDGKNYWGTKEEIFGKIGFSASPFSDIQKRTQENLNNYLTIATIPAPTLPAPLALVKDEFETKAEFSARVEKESAGREAEIARLQEKYRQEVEARNTDLESRKANIETKKKEFLFQNFVLTMGEPKLSNATYDPETSTMFVDVVMSNADWKKKVSILMNDRAKAKIFKDTIKKAPVKVAFEYENEAFILKNITIDFGTKSSQIKKIRVIKGIFSDSTEEYFETVNEPIHLVAILADTDYKPERVAVTLENKKVAFNELQNPNLADKYQVQALGYGESNSAKGLKYDDDLAPLLKTMKAEKPNPKNWLFAVAIEKYDEADAVIYAKNSATSLIAALQKRLGISERNTYALIDEKATGGAIKGQLERLLENVKEGDNIYFYYSGHGIPSSENGEAFILPKDVIADYVTREKEFMARNIYKKLSDSKAGKVVAFVDSCYSGKTDGISNIKGVAAGVFKTKKVEFDTSKMVVMTAGTNGQFSNAYSEKGQRLFSYFVTKALINRPTLDINSLYQEVSVGVKDESFKLGDNKRQEPQIEGNVEMGL